MELARKPRDRHRSMRLETFMSVPEMDARIVNVFGKPQRVEVEASVWEGLREISKREEKKIDDLYEEVFFYCGKEIGFESSLRVYVLNYFKNIGAE